VQQRSLADGEHWPGAGSPLPTSLQFLRVKSRSREDLYWAALHLGSIDRITRNTQHTQHANVNLIQAWVRSSQRLSLAYFLSRSLEQTFVWSLGEDPLNSHNLVFPNFVGPFL
jgi:hypothetical protein